MEGAPNHLQTTWVWIEVSYLAEQPLRCDLLKVSLQDPPICPQTWTGKSVGGACLFPLLCVRVRLRRAGPAGHWPAESFSYLYI